MPEVPGVAYEYVRAGDTIVVPCPNDQGPSLSMEWRTTGSDTVIGHWLSCVRCRPDSVWSCAFCPELVEPDAVAIRSHVIDRHG